MIMSYTEVQVEKVDENQNFLFITVEFELHKSYCVGIWTLNKLCQDEIFMKNYEPHNWHLLAVSAIIGVKPEVLKFQSFV